MPIFDLKCTKCAHIEEVVCNYADVESMRCPNCDSKLAINLANQRLAHIVKGFAARNGYHIPRTEDDK